MSDQTPAEASASVQVPIPNSDTPTPAPAPAEEPAKGASATSEQPPAPATEPEAPPQDQNAERKPKGRWQERVDQLTARNTSLRAQLEAATRQLQELNRPLQEPDPQNWDATEAHRLRSIMREERATEVTQNAHQIAHQLAQTRLETFETKLADAADRIRDIETVKQQFYSSIPITDPAADVLADSAHAADVTAHLVRNQADAQRFARMTPAQQVAEIGRLSGIYEARASAPPVRRVSQAPAPPPTIGGGAPSAAKSPQEMSVAEMQALLYGGRKR